MFKCLDDGGLCLRLSKCQFVMQEVVYCGQRINKEGIRLVKEKVEAIGKVPHRRDPAEVLPWNAEFLS